MAAQKLAKKRGAADLEHHSGQKEVADTSLTKRKASTSSVGQPRRKRRATTKTGPVSRLKKSPASASEINPVPSQSLNILVFGEGENAELGLGPKLASSKVPRLNPFLDPKDASKFHVVQVACGGMHTAALTSDNKIITWGVNDAGALGRNTEWDGGLRDVDDESDDDVAELNPLESTPDKVPSKYFQEHDRFAEVAAGDNCTFVLTTGGEVYGWGTFRNAQGDECFGYDIDNQPITRQITPRRIHGIPGIVKIVCGTNHVLALDKNGALWGWGVNDENQLGRRLFSRGHNSYIPQLLRICRSKIVYIASGQCHSFAVDQQSNVWGWGRNSNCEAGYSPASTSDAVSCLPYPMKIKALSGRNMKLLSGGGSHSCAVTTDGQCFAWGKMDSGQLGIDFTANQLADEVLIRRGIHSRPAICTSPTPLQNLGTVTYAACGTDHTIFVSTDGKAFATGFGFQGQLGLGSDEDFSVATHLSAKSVRDRKISWAGAGGGFSVIAEVV